MTDDDMCRCSLCDRTFRDVEDFDRHRSRGRCRTSDTYGPHPQGSRDLIEDMGLLDSGGVGSGDLAQHAEAAMPS